MHKKSLCTSLLSKTLVLLDLSYQSGAKQNSLVKNDSSLWPQAVITEQGGQKPCKKHISALIDSGNCKNQMSYRMTFDVCHFFPVIERRGHFLCRLRFFL